MKNWRHFEMDSMYCYTNAIAVMDTIPSMSSLYQEWKLYLGALEKYALGDCAQRYLEKKWCDGEWIGGYRWVSCWGVVITAVLKEKLESETNDLSTLPRLIWGSHCHGGDRTRNTVAMWTRDRMVRIFFRNVKVPGMGFEVMRKEKVKEVYSTETFTE